MAPSWPGGPGRQDLRPKEVWCACAPRAGATIRGAPGGPGQTAGQAVSTSIETTSLPAEGKIAWGSAVRQAWASLRAIFMLQGAAAGGRWTAGESLAADRLLVWSAARS